ncbi:major facilitator superfamily domain-containing protein [Lineolata rhizophorae]|uniref:Major facilitator superfamily domain-containing protein n=1 Tax=Lineolata rhizophorae TaxID=578093 RepID=A0A6A6PDH1_9PEZI|nr:major facilitator superfamily domain-containing protein [Lineolata rhizophorae]
MEEPSTEKLDSLEGHAAVHARADAVTTTFDAVVEKRIRRKLDYTILPVAILMYLFAFIDRANVGNAKILGMEEDLDLTGDRFNIGLTTFFTSYIFFEVPANAACKKLGPKIWVPFLGTTFGLTTMLMSTMTNYKSFYAARFMLGVFESGIMPSLVYLLSCFYRRHELVSRVGVYASFSSLSGAFGGLLASGLFYVPQWGMIHTWRNIFFFEGLISTLIGIGSYFVIANHPSQAWFFTEEEKQVASYRMAQETRAQHTEGLSWRYFKRAIFNINVLLVCVADACCLCVMNSMALFTPTILRSMGFSRIQSQLMSVPPYAWATLVCVSVTFLSDRTRTRGVWLLFAMPFTIVGFAIQLGVDGPTGLLYFSVFCCLTGAFTAAPMLIAWAVENSSGYTTRAIVAGLTAGWANLGGLVATWTYMAEEAPRYTTGHAINCGAAVLCTIIVAITTVYLRWENKQRTKGKRDHRIQGITMEEAADLGHKHPEYVFTP